MDTNSFGFEDLLHHQFTINSSSRRRRRRGSDSPQHQQHATATGLEVTPVDDVREKKYHHDLDLIQPTSTLNDGRSMNTKEERSGWTRGKGHNKDVDVVDDDLVDPTHRDTGCSILLKGILDNIDHHASFGDEEQESVDARSRAMIGMVESRDVSPPDLPLPPQLAYDRVCQELCCCPVVPPPIINNNELIIHHAHTTPPLIPPTSQGYAIAAALTQY
ncbi:hypothetical protein FOZ62_006464 [Perkinsus olseni]|uniref:Uncharacterized protein n=1 Tax=Perkinsus olseni TaxID=32597 RepID=A0A7J6NVE3_PEROL|nr:hypothetical protein FOZ62_006464 [Perkinsus olseni]